jgi:hypothetical protein
LVCGDILGVLKRDARHRWARPRGGGLLHLVSELTRGFTSACGRNCAGMVCMAGVGHEWSHSMAHVLALDPQTWPREDVPGLGLIDTSIF